MKKAFAIVLSLILVISGFSLTAVAAVPAYTAAYGTPTVDGVVHAAEYGAAVPFNKSNLSLFYYNSANEDPTGANANYPDITYAFAWNEKGLYVGITSLASKTDIGDGKFQFDLSPEKKIKDGKRGIFFTLKVLSSTVSIARDNFQTGGSKKVSENITRRDGVQGAAQQVGDRWNIEVFIPISELQVTASISGASGSFSKLEMKAGTWGVGCYYIGNGGGYTSTQGSGANSFDSQSGEGELIEYYNNLVLAPAGSTPTPGGDTSGSGSNTSGSGNTSGGSSNTGSGSNSSGGNTSGSGSNAGSGSNTSGSGNPSGGSTVTSEESSDADLSSDLPEESRPSDVTRDPVVPTESGDDTDTDTPVKKKSSALLVLLIAAAVVLAAAVAGIVIYLVKNQKTTPANSDTTDEWSGKNDR